MAFLALFYTDFEIAHISVIAILRESQANTGGTGILTCTEQPVVANRRIEGEIAPCDGVTAIIGAGIVIGALQGRFVGAVAIRTGICRANISVIT